MTRRSSGGPIASVCLAVILVAAAGAGLSSAHLASPQSTQATPAVASAADAKPFLGSWTTTFNSPQGAVMFDIEIHLDTGDPGATVKNALIGESTVTDVTKAGASLILRYVVEVQGTQVDVTISLAPDGENLKADFSFMGGQYSTSSIATRKK